MKKINEREIALFAFTDIISDLGYNNIILRKTFEKERDLDKRQKGFITEIVNGSLRNLILIDYIISKFSKTKIKKIKPMILNIMRISVYQIMFMDKSPDSAVVNEAVNLVKAKGYSGLSGYTNGVLRNIIRNKGEIEYPDFEKSPKEYLSVKYSYPEWLINYLADFLDINILKEFCISSNNSPKVNICINTLKTNKEDLIKILIEEGMEVSEGKLVSNALILSNTSDIKASKAFQEGLFHVMDESSMVAVLAAGVSPKDLVYDLCAAPGGKSFNISYIMENKGKVIANDIHNHKITLLEEGAKRLGIDNIETREADSAILNEDMVDKADCVILDAPCSGLGLIRKKPDIKYNKTMEDIESLVKIQRQLLFSASKYPKIGGTLIYSTCTLSKKENEENIEYFLKNYPYELGDLKEVLPKETYEKIETKTKGYTTLMPNIHGTDGFFVARLIRKG